MESFFILEEKLKHETMDLQKEIFCILKSLEKSRQHLKNLYRTIPDRLDFSNEFDATQ